MSWRKPLIVLLYYFTAATLYGSSITFNGPFGPADANQISGDPLIFGIQNATLSQPTFANGPWNLTINTNYGTVLPGTTEVVPPFEDGGVTFAMSDFLIEQGNNFYGVVLTPHDGYQAGDVYIASGFQNAFAFHTNDPVYLDPGGSLFATGTITAGPNPGANGITVAEYQITVSFNAPVTFLSSGSFAIDMSSADCANAFFTGTGDFSGGGGTSGVSDVPEPGTWFCVGGGLMLFGYFARRRKAH